MRHENQQVPRHSGQRFLLIRNPDFQWLSGYRVKPGMTGKIVCGTALIHIDNDPRLATSHEGTDVVEEVNSILNQIILHISEVQRKLNTSSLTVLYHDLDNEQVIIWMTNRLNCYGSAMHCTRKRSSKKSRSYC